MNVVPDGGQVTRERLELSRLKIVHVVRQYAPMVGGLEDFVQNLVAQQVGRVADVRVVTLDRLFSAPDKRLPAQDVIDGVDVRRIPFHGSSRYPLAPSILNHLGNADLVHVHAVDFFFDALALTRFLHGKKLVATTHGGFFHTRQNSKLKALWFNTLTRYSASRYAAIACCSESDLELFKRVAPRRVRLIENGVDLAKFSDAASHEPQKRLVTIGRFSANKRLDQTFLALKELVAHDPEWRLEVIGSESDWTVADLRARLEELGLTGHVHIQTGLSDTEVRQVLDRCSLFVSASDYEGFGIALIEALSAGLIPVVHANAAFKTLARRHPLVHLADYDNPKSAAESISKAMARIDQAPVLRMSAMSSAKVHGWPETAVAYDRMYLDALTGETQ